MKINSNEYRENYRIKYHDLHCKPSRGRGCLKTDLEAVGRTADYISSGQGGFRVTQTLPRVQTFQFMFDSNIS